MHCTALYAINAFIIRQARFYLFKSQNNRFSHILPILASFTEECLIITIFCECSEERNFCLRRRILFPQRKLKKNFSRKYPIQGQNKNLCIHIYKEFFNYVEWNFMSTFLAKISINIHMNLILNRSLSIVPTMFCL